MQLWKLFFVLGLLTILSKPVFAVGKLSQPYIGFEVGYSSSLPVGMSVDEAPNSMSKFVWDPPLQGWNSDLGNSAIYGIDLGYNFTRLFALELAYNYRPSYQYSKYQTVPTSKAIGSRIRYFDFNNYTIMLDGILRLFALTPNLASLQERTIIEPIVDLGVGLASNTVTNFHGLCVDKQPGMIFSKMGDKTKYSFAAQAGAGFDLNFNKTWSARLGYRFLYGGKFNTQDYVTDDPDNQHPITPGSGNSANAWKGTFTANEIYARLNVAF